MLEPSDGFLGVERFFFLGDIPSASREALHREMLLPRCSTAGEDLRDRAALALSQRL